MRKVLYILGQLDDLDVAWLARQGHRTVLDLGKRLITEGERTDALYIVLEGGLAVTMRDGRSVATLGAGEVVGELSFVDSAPPSATVTAAEPSSLLAVPRDRLNAKLAEDQAFAARFYKAMALFLADRLRGTVRHFGYGQSEGGLATDEVLEDELDDSILDSVSIAGERFDRMLRILAGTAS